MTNDHSPAAEPELMLDDPLGLERQLCFALAAASRSVIAMYRPVLEPLGLTHPQYLVMLALWERSPRTLADISAALHLDPSTLSPLVKRLERDGLIVRGRDGNDDRSLAIAVTAEGEALRDQAVRIPEEIVRRLDLPLAELERTRDALHVLLDAANAARTRD